jgi:hypothetical protein
MTWKNRNEANTTNYLHPNESNLWELHKAMDYNSAGEPIIRVDDTTVQHTATNRRKVSTSEMLYFNTFQYGKDPSIWDESITGTAAITFDSVLGMVDMSVGSSVGDQAVQQSRRIIRYIPGRQNELTFTVIFTEPTVGVRRRVGLFNEQSGFYFEDGGDGNYYCVIRRNTASGVVETRVAREDWNVDRFDGQGPSGVVADPRAIQMVVFEYNWYGAGQVEISWIVNNNKLPIHQFETANILTHTWTNTAFLPVRKEITNVSGAPGTHHMYIGSSSISAEGDVGPLGRESNVNSPITGRSLGAANTFFPVLSIRLKADRLAGVVIPVDFQAATLDNTTIFYRLVQNPVLTGAVWTSVSNESFVEYDATATAATNGTVLKTGFLGTYQQGQVLGFDSRTVTQLGRSAMGAVSDILTVEIASTQANKAGFSSINWIELR